MGFVVDFAVLSGSTILNGLGNFFVFLNLLTSSADFTNVGYEGGSAYLAHPENIEEGQKYPAAIVLHEWNGMSSDMVWFSDQLAEEGIVAIAPDMFRGVAASSTNIPWNILTTLLTPQYVLDSATDAAIAHLQSLDYVDDTSIISGPGFCFGGTQVLQVSRRNEVKATVSLYGAGVDQYGDPNSDNWGFIGANDAPVLGIFGALDGAPTPGEATNFENAMNERGIINTVTIYDGVGHAFVNEEAYENGQEQAVDAWDQVVAFIKDTVAVSFTSTSEPSIQPTGIFLERKLDVQLKNRSSGYDQHISKLAKKFTKSSMLWDHLMDYVYKKGHFDPSYKIKVNQQDVSPSHAHVYEGNNLRSEVEFNGRRHL